MCSLIAFTHAHQQLEILFRVLAMSDAAGVTSMFSRDLKLHGYNDDTMVTP